MAVYKKKWYKIWKLTIFVLALQAKICKMQEN